MPKHHRTVSVVGAGVIGLTTARVLSDRGWRVRVIADRTGLESTSGAAAAVWYPHDVGPMEVIAPWARDTWRWLEALGGEEPEAGVLSPTPLFLAADSDARPEWEVAVPQERRAQLRFVRLADLTGEIRRIAERMREVEGSPGPPAGAWRLEAPMVDARRHLEWLGRGQTVERRRVEALEEELGRSDRVVNCAGPRAATLARRGDGKLRPNWGQVVVGALPSRFFRDFAWSDARCVETLVYAFRRGREVVLGGHGEPGDAKTEPWTRPPPYEPRPGVEKKILERWRILLDGLPEQEWKSRCGWRPSRKEVRLGPDAKDERIVHNYGHGGAGFTVAYGCALQVAELLERE